MENTEIKKKLFLKVATASKEKRNCDFKKLS